MNDDPHVRLVLDGDRVVKVLPAKEEKPIATKQQRRTCPLPRSQSQ